MSLLKENHIVVKQMLIYITTLEWSWLLVFSLENVIEFRWLGVPTIMSSSLLEECVLSRVSISDLFFQTFCKYTLRLLFQNCL